MTPVVAFHRLICSVLLGGCLGLAYGFFRPLGRGHRILADVLFSLTAVWIWIYICFAVCRGNIRTVYLLGMFSGCLLWEKTVGFRIRPVFDEIWRIFRWVFRIFLFPWKKILDFAKILFASAEKWVTIKCTKISKAGQKRRNKSHGKQKHPTQKSESGSSSCIQYP